MGLFDKASRLIRSEMPEFQAGIAKGLKELGNDAEKWLSAAEARTFGNDGPNGSFNRGDYTETYHSTPQTPSPHTQAHRKPFSQLPDFTRVLNEGALEPQRALKLLSIAETRGFTPELKTWLHSAERNKNTVVEPLTTLLGDRSQHEAVQSEVFYRAHKLGLQQDILRWLKSRPNLTDTVGMSYRNFNLKMTQVPDSLKLPHPLNLTEEDFAFGKQFARTISNELQSRS